MSTIDYSIRGILKVVLPLILSVLSVNLMYAADRLILAQYSIDAMNAAAISSYIISLITYPFISVASVAEIYVGQYNGAEQYDKVAVPVWQMIYFAIFSSVFLAVCAAFTEYLNWLPEFYKQDGVVYQRINLLYAGISVLFSAISAFFVGQGKTVLLTIAIIIGNISNIILDFVLIFGVDGYIQPMGVAGAAIATVISNFVQLVIISAAFFKHSNIVKYMIFKKRAFDKEIFCDCIKIGMPITVGRVLEISAWYVVYIILSHVSKDLATINGIAGTVYAIFIFFGEGINKGAATLAANLIGMGNLAGIKRLFRIFNIFVIIFGLLLFIPVEFYFDELMHIMHLDSANIVHLYGDIKNVILLVVLCVTMESVLFIISGILISGGDSKMQMIINMSCLWVCMVLPICFLYMTHNISSVTQTYSFACLWAALSTVFLYIRYRSLKWYKKLV